MTTVSGEDVEAIIAAELKAAKIKNPVELLPKSTFILDEWKRFYSNNDTPVAMEWLWNNIDLEGYSIWKVDYKYNDELTQTFMSSNLISGFYQSLDKYRKYIFGNMVVLGIDNNNCITGYFILRGQDLSVFTDQNDIDNWSFNKIELESKKQKIGEVFEWKEIINGKTCASGKTFK
jgi:elongation factor 1-gamma